MFTKSFAVAFISQVVVITLVTASSFAQPSGRGGGFSSMMGGGGMSNMLRASTILQLGATPIFIDCDVRTMNLDKTDLAKKITDKTKGCCYLG